MNMTTERSFTFEKVANMVFCVSVCGLVWYAWHAEDFTERKKRNAIARLKKAFNGDVIFYFNGV